MEDKNLKSYSSYQGGSHDRKEESRKMLEAHRKWAKEHEVCCKETPKCRCAIVWKIIIAVIVIVTICGAVFYFTANEIHAGNNHMEISYGANFSNAAVVNGYVATKVHAGVALYLSEKCKVSCKAEESWDTFKYAWDKKDFSALYPSLDFEVTHLF